MEVGQVIRFQDERFFEGAVQLGWTQKRTEQAQYAASSFVFHGPRYHGAPTAQEEGVEVSYRLKDTASFVQELLDSILAGLDGVDSNPYWLVVAGYGSGKSHLALTCASLLGALSEPTTANILEQLVRADAKIGEEAKRKIKRLGKPALVIPLDGMSGFHLGNALSRSVFAQLSLHGVDSQALRDLSPRYQTAEHFVRRNYSIRVEAFQKVLPGLDAEQICYRLQDQDEAVYSEVNNLFAEANGRPIPVEGQESAQDLIDTLCSFYCGSDGPFSSVVIMFDEFGRYLEYAAEKPHISGDSVLQQIFQGVQDNSGKIRFLGFIQYELRTYLKRFGGADLRQLQRYVTRFDAAEKFYLSTNLETIFAHMLGKSEGALDELWRTTDAEHRSALSWQRMSAVLPGFNRFPVWSDKDKFSHVIARGCWPLHPLAVWFLTRQRDLVQSRSALTFIKDLVSLVSEQPANIGHKLRQVSAAELLLQSMLPELIAAERESGGTTAETLQMLLEKFSGHLDLKQRYVLAGIAAIEKMRVGKRTQNAMNELLCEATSLDSESLPPQLAYLSELGAVEWNRDLGHYELLSDGTSRAQFQQWLRKHQSAFTFEAYRDLFLRRGAVDCQLADIHTDFAVRQHISTSDFYFEAQFAHTHVLKNTLRQAFEEWQQARHPKEAKGKVIYLYVHQEEDDESIGLQIQNLMQLELQRLGLSKAPIWVIAIVDGTGQISGHLGQLHLLNEQISASDEERFRRFIPEDRDRSKNALIQTVQEAIKQRRYFIAGIATVPTGRMSAVGQAIFSEVYPKTVPFPFDGFATGAGGGPADTAQLMRGLIARQVNGSWVQTQPRKLQNRVNAVLIESWKALLPNGKLCEPTCPEIRSLYKTLEEAHKQNPEHSLLSSYQEMIRPPYGLNSSSAGLLLALMLGSETPSRRIEQNGNLIASSDWIARLFVGQRTHHMDEKVLNESRLRFLSEDSTARWRSLLNRWEGEQNYGQKLELMKQAENLKKVEAVPEVFEGNYKYLLDATKVVLDKMHNVEGKFKTWERDLERAEREHSIVWAIKLGGQVHAQKLEMESSQQWPESYAKQCDQLIALAKAQIAPGVKAWIPSQTCQSVIHVNDFRFNNERLSRALENLGFAEQSRLLVQQTQSSIQRVEQLQKFSQTLAESDDYPRQPAPTDSTTARLIRDELARGDTLIQSLESAHKALSKQEIDVRVGAIKQRQKTLRDALEQKRDTLGDLYSTPNSERELREAVPRARRLRMVFVSSPEEREVNELILQLERILASVESWDTGQNGPERTEEILSEQVLHQSRAMGDFLKEKGIDPAWELAEVYQAIALGRVAAIKQRSQEWAQGHLALKVPIGELTRSRCLDLERELLDAPGYLALEDRAQVEDLLKSVQAQIVNLDEQLRREQVGAWLPKYQGLQDVSKFTYHQAEELLLELRKPPYKLRADEQSLVEPTITRLTSHLDQLSINDIVSRISKLPLEHQRKIHDYLAMSLGTRS